MEEKDRTHPDFGELEAHRRGEADEATAAHLAVCPQCRSHLQEIEALVGLVRGSQAPLPTVPDEIENRILHGARQNAARVRRQRARSSVRRWAMAASLLLTAGAVVVWRAVRQDSASPAPLPRDRGGAMVSKLDIVDALALARHLSAAQATLRGTPGAGNYDVNRDGHVDDADVERIVRQVVALGDA